MRAILHGVGSCASPSFLLCRTPEPTLGVMSTLKQIAARIARLLPKNADLWRLGREFHRWRKETGLSDARLIELLDERFPDVDLPIHLMKGLLNQTN